MSTLRLLFSICITVAMISCSTSRLSKEERAQIKQNQAEFVINSIEKMDFEIEVDQVTLNRGITRNLNYGYSLAIKKDTIKSYLPYFGRAYTLPITGSKGLNFDAKILDYQISRNADKALTQMEIITRNDEDTFQYSIQIFDNGRSFIKVRSRQREQISFYGRMTMPLEYY